MYVNDYQMIIQAHVRHPSMDSISSVVSMVSMVTVSTAIDTVREAESEVFSACIAAVP